MKVILEIPQIAGTLLERWAQRNGLELQDHLTELVKSDVRTIVREVGARDLDGLLDLDSVTVAVVAELEGKDLGRYAPFLDVVGAEQGRVDIRDNKLDCIAEVTYRDDSWYCDFDNKDSCVHIGFAMAVLKVRETMTSLQARDGQ